MKCSRQQPPLPDQCRRPIARSQRLYRRSRPHNPWRSDEHHLQRPTRQRRLRRQYRRLILPPIRVPLHRNIHHPKRSLRRVRHLFRQQNAPRARPKYRLRVHEPIQRIIEPCPLQMLQKRSRLPTRQHQPIQPLKLFRLPYQTRTRAQLSQSLCMDIERALQRKHADRW